MNAAHFHLLINHLPVTGVAFGFVMLVIGMIRRNDTLRATSLVLFILAGLIAVPTYLSGEPAREVVEDLVSFRAVGRHADAAWIALLATEALALVSVASWIVRRRPALWHRFLVVSLALSAIATGLMIRTANLGGQVRHTEIGNQAEEDE